MILAERDETGAFTAAADGVLEKRRYYGQNWRSDTAMVATDTGKLVENVKYFSNGVGKRFHVADTDGDGDWDATDAAAITGAYDVLKDADMDGDVDANDITQANAFGGYTSTPLGTISIVENRKGYAGYELEPNLNGSKFHVRHRVLDGELGRWTRRDPLGYVDGSSLFAYVGNRPQSRQDPTRLAYLPVDCYPNPCSYTRISNCSVELFGQCGMTVHNPSGQPPTCPDPSTTLAQDVLCRYTTSTLAKDSNRCDRMGSDCLCAGTWQYRPKTTMISSVSSTWYQIPGFPHCFLSFNCDPVVNPGKITYTEGTYSGNCAKRGAVSTN